MKKFGLIFMMSCLIFSLAGCKSNEFDAVAYVKGSLDAYCTGEVSDELANNSSESKEELQKQVDAAYKEVENTIIKQTFGEKYVTKKTKKLAGEYAKSFYGAIKYDVSQNVEEKDGTYTVSVTIYPFKTDDFSNEVKKLNKKWENKADEYDSNEAFIKAFYEEYIESFVNFLKDKNNMKYAEGKDLKIRLTKDKDGNYIMNEKDAAKIFSSIYV